MPVDGRERGMVGGNMEGFKEALWLREEVLVTTLALVLKCYLSCAVCIECPKFIYLKFFKRMEDL